MEPPKTVILSVTLVNEVLDYLSNQPFKETYNLISAVQNEANAQPLPPQPKEEEPRGTTSDKKTK